MKKRAYEDACFNLTITGMAFTSVIVLPFLGLSMCFRLLYIPYSKAVFLTSCQQTHTLTECTDAWNEAK
jgi:hypothetical protein